MAKERILITGAGGYIGGPVLEQFVNQLNVGGFDIEYIVAVDRTEVTPNPDVITSLNAKWISINLDEVNTAWWESTIVDNNITSIYYLESIENSNLCSVDNLFINRMELSDFYFIDFLEKRIKIGTDIKLLYISTDKIYYLDTFPNEIHDIVLKTSKKEQQYFYNYVAIKALTETKLKYIDDVDSRIIRPFSITGPGRNEECPLSKYINRALINQDIQVYESGQQGVAFTHVNDLVTMLIHPNLFDSDVKQDLTTNVINFCRVQNYLSVRQLTEKIINKTEATSKITEDNPVNEFVEVQHTPQIRNMVRVYQPTIPIEILLDDMIYELNPINHYVDLVVFSVNLDEIMGTIRLVGSAEPDSAITVLFGNGEAVSDDVTNNGNFDINYTFEYPIDVYPIEIKVTTNDYIQYASEVITLPI